MGPLGGLLMKPPPESSNRESQGLGGGWGERGGEGRISRLGAVPGFKLVSQVSLEDFSSEIQGPCAP